MIRLLLPSVLLGVLTLFVASPISASSCFELPSILQSEEVLRSVVAGDLNNDLRTDAVGVQSDGNSVVVFLNSPGTGLELDSVYTLGSHLNSFNVPFALGDMNHDGFLDIAVASSNDDSITILLNDGNGTFSIDVEGPSGLSSPHSLAVADFDGDTIPDMAIITPFGVEIAMNNGDSSFSAATTYSTSFAASGMFTGDLNGDSAIDIGVSGPFDVSVHINNGDGTFATAVQYAVSSTLSLLSGLDLDQDDDLDLVVLSATDQARALINDGLGGFAAPIDYPIAGSPTGVAIGDINGDVIDDAVVSTQSDGIVSILISNGDGSFAPRIDVLTSVEPADNGGAGGLVLGNFVGDPSLDICVAKGGTLGPRVAILENYSDGAFSAINTINLEEDLGPSLVSPGPPISTDFDLDGNLDVAVGLGSGGYLRVYNGVGNGIVQDPQVIEMSIWEPRYLAVADVDKQDGPDIIVTSGAPVVGDDSVFVLINNGDGSFQPEVGFFAGHAPSYPTASDLNGDGFPDIVVAAGGLQIPSGAQILLNNGDGTFTSPITYETTTNLNIVVTDVNHDLILDIVSCGKTDEMSVMLGFGDGTFQTPVIYTALSTFQPDILVAGDFNNDLHQDIVVAGGTNSISIFDGVGDGSFVSAEVVALTFEPTHITGVHVDSDNNLDLAIANSTFQNLSLLINNGDGSFSPPELLPGGEAPVFLTVSDLNNDVVADLVVSSNDFPEPTLLTLINCSDVRSCTCPYKSDLNADMFLDAVDLNAEIDLLFFGGSNPMDPECPITRGDFNSDGLPDVVDLNLLIDHLFFGGLPPVDPCSP